MPSARARVAVARRLAGFTGTMSTQVISAMEADHPWFHALGAEERSYISLVAREGIDGFVRWFTDDADSPSDPASIFNVAPRALTRRITLHQTVDLLRTTIEVVEEQIQQLMPRADRPALQTAIVLYSREVAFAAAEVYARAAELRGSWDDHIEALVVDAVVRADPDEALLSRASTLGWPSDAKVLVAVGRHTEGANTAQREALRRAADALHANLLSSVQGSRLVALITSPGLVGAGEGLKLVQQLSEHFGPGPIVVGPVVPGLQRASVSARSALSGARCAAAWPEGPRVMASEDLLPERVLAGNGHARRELIENVYQVLEAAGGDLLQTTVAFLDHSGSVEATARDIFVHANTVRYRLKRIHDVTGYQPSDPRHAYVLRLAITLGRLHEAQES